MTTYLAAMAWHQYPALRALALLVGLSLAYVLGSGLSVESSPSPAQQPATAVTAATEPQLVDCWAQELECQYAAELDYRARARGAQVGR